MNKKRILDRMRKLKDLFDKDAFPKTHNHEVNPGLPKESLENYVYFTLPVSINFQRSSPAMWASALKTYEDESTRYLFSPQRVLEYPREKVMKDLTKHKLGLQRNRHTDIWISLSRTFNREYENNPRNLLEQNSFTVSKIVNLLRFEKKKDFPYLSGPKMSNYWLFILSKYTDAIFLDSENISIVPDTHIIQSSKRLGLVGEKTTPDEVAEVWFDLLKGSDLKPIDLHSILWNWSRNGFQPEI
jgi:hypothetical protein